MKKVILTTIIALVTVAGAMAQNVAVSATVNATLSVIPTDVAFGVIAANTVSYIQANGDDATPETNLGTGHSPGALQITGTVGVDVTISWTTGTLTDGDGANPIVFTPAVYLGSEISSGDTNVTLTNGDITLGVGGSLAVIANAGVYSTANGGTASPVAFTVAYTNV